MHRSLDPGEIDPLELGLLPQAAFIVEPIGGGLEQVVGSSMSVAPAGMQDGRKIPGLAVGRVGHFIQLNKMLRRVVAVTGDELITDGIEREGKIRQQPLIHSADRKSVV